jgi:hypothetical protein
MEGLPINENDLRLPLLRRAHESHDAAAFLSNQKEERESRAFFSFSAATREKNSCATTRQGPTWAAFV